MKKILFVIWLLSLSAIFTGCSGADEPFEEMSPEPQEVSTEEGISSETYTEEEEVSIPTEFHKMYDENFSCDLKVTASVEYLKKPQCVQGVRIQNVDPDKARDLFFSGINTEIEDVDMSGEEPYIYLRGEGGESFLYSSRSFSYSKPFSAYIMQAFRLEQGEGYNADEYDQNRDLSFMNRDTAFETIMEVLENLGVQTHSRKYKCYSLDFSTLSEQEFAIDLDGKEDPSQYKESWSEEDECYYFIIKQEEQGIPLYAPISEVFQKFEDINAQIQVLFSSRGIEMIQITGIMEWDKNFEKVSLTDFETVMDHLYYKYSMVISDAVYQVNSADLVYLAAEEKRGTYSMKPAWVIKMKVEYKGNEGQQTQEIQTLIDAVSGKELL